MRLAEIQVGHTPDIIRANTRKANGTCVLIAAKKLTLRQNGTSQVTIDDSDTSKRDRVVRGLAQLTLFADFGYLELPATTRLFFTEKTLGTPLARRPARFLSVSLSTTPSSVTVPFFTMMWMEGTADQEYFERLGSP